MPAASMRRSKCLTIKGEPKRVYTDEEEAKEVRRMRIAGGCPPEAVGVYWCDYCNEGFHVGRRPQSRNEHRYQGGKRKKGGRR